MKIDVRVEGVKGESDEWMEERGWTEGICVSGTLHLTRVGDGRKK